MTDYVDKIAFDNNETVNIGGPQFNGKWVMKSYTAVSNMTLDKDAHTTISLNNYLPNDGNNYEVTFMLIAYTGGASGNSVEIQCHAGSTITSKPVVRAGYAITRQNANEHFTKTGYLYINSSDRSITCQNKGGQQTTGFYFYLRGYRRIGLNDMSSEYISNINVNGTNALIGGNNFDGGWTPTSIEIVNQMTLNSGGHYDIPLDSHLPNDGHDYLVYVCGWGDTGGSSGNTTRMKVINGKYADVSAGKALDFYMFGGATRTGSTRAYGGCALIPVYANNKNISINNTGNASANFRGFIRGYKKLGYNQDGIDRISMTNKIVPFSGMQFDGPWVVKDEVIGTYSSMTSGTTYSIDLSDKLPNDGYVYEILVDAYIWTSTTAGQGAEAYIRGNGLTDNIMLIRCNTRSSSQCDMCSIIIPIGSTRVLSMLNSIGSTSGSCNVYLRGYRRTGISV